MMRSSIGRQQAGMWTGGRWGMRAAASLVCDAGRGAVGGKHQRRDRRPAAVAVCAGVNGHFSSAARYICRDEAVWIL